MGVGLREKGTTAWFAFVRNQRFHSLCGHLFNTYYVPVTEQGSGSVG